jgi:hypothetical protein
MPPSPANYVQRAGRAGRRVDSAALVVTFAQRRSHDRQFFDNPSDMIRGVISTPMISLTNEQIVRRHLHAVAYAAFQRHAGESYKTVEQFFTGDDAPVAAMIGWLRSHPTELGSALQRITPPEVSNELGDDTWEWVERLIEPDHEGGSAWLDPSLGRSPIRCRRDQRP